MNLIETVQKEVSNIDTVLDVGCGIQNHTKHLDCYSLLGIDAHEPYVHIAKNINPTILGTLQNLNTIAVDNSFDVVLCLDVIEHLEKEEAIQGLAALERVAKRKVVIFTTDGFEKQEDGEGWGKGNPTWQKHRCGFEKEELEALGYRTIRACLGLFAVKDIL